MKIRHFSDLQIWQSSISLTKEIYQLTSSYPSTERFGLIDQMRRASSSIGANLAEGFGRFSQREKVQFLYISRGSLMELEHFLYLSLELGFINENSSKNLLSRCEILEKSLNAYLSQLRKYVNSAANQLINQATTSAGWRIG